MVRFRLNFLNPQNHLSGSSEVMNLSTRGDNRHLTDNLRVA